MKTKIAFFLICLSVFIVSSCGGTTEAQRQCNIRVGIVFDIGGKNDRSFNAAAWEGVERAERDLNICLYDVEPGNPTSIEPAMRAFAEKNFDLIIGVGFAQGPIMQKVAEDYPNIKFAIVDGVLFRPLPYPAAARLATIEPGFRNIPSVPNADGVRPIRSASQADIANWQAAVPEAKITGYSAARAAEQTLATRH